MTSIRFPLLGLALLTAMVPAAAFAQDAGASVPLRIAQNTENPDAQNAESPDGESPATEAQPTEEQAAPPTGRG